MSFRNGKFGRLTVSREIAPDIFLCVCTCGTEIEVWRSLLVGNIQRDCGCVHPTASVHGHTRTFKTRDGRKLARKSREYQTWSNMIGRCYNTNHHAFSSYGGRGIKICERWMPDGTGQGFRNFLADLGPRPVGMTLDRIDPQGHYEPTNVRWATAEVQGRNKRIHLWPDGDMPPVEDAHMMESRVKQEWDEANPF